MVQTSNKSTNKPRVQCIDIGRKNNLQKMKFGVINHSDLQLLKLSQLIGFFSYILLDMISWILMLIMDLTDLLMSEQIIRYHQ